MTVPQHATGPSPGAYDFRRPMTLAREHARVLEIALGTFSRQWANQLLATLRLPTQVTLGGVSMSSYEDYITSLPARTTVVRCAVGPNRRSAFLEFPIDAALTWVDHMLGGPGTPGAVPERDLTDIEQQLIGQLVTRLLADLDYSFYGIVAVDAELRRIHHVPQLIQATAASAAVITAAFTITVDDHSVAASMMLPADVFIAAMRERDADDRRTPEEVAAEQEHLAELDRAVQHAPVDVTVRLAPEPVHPRDVLGLAVGDVLHLRHPSSQPMDVVVGDRVLAQAVAGTSGSRLAGLVVNVKENS